MTKRECPSLRRLTASRLALLLLATTVATALPALAEGQQAAPAPAAPATDSGMKVNVDPKTGRFLEEPAADPGTPSKRAVEAPLVMEPSAVEGGGIGFRVPDQRFDSEMKATVSPDGKADIDCNSPAK